MDREHRLTSALDSDQERAERLLYELASDLRFVAVGERTRALHVRALELKGAVRRWRAECPDARARDATCDEIVALQKHARAVLGRSAFAMGEGLST